VPLPFAATRLARDDDFQYGICMDTHLHLQASRGGGCALGPAGEVACFTPGERTWTVSAGHRTARGDCCVGRV